MPTLTASQIDDFRAMCGVLFSTETEITDPKIQAFYDRAVAFGYDTDLTEARTNVYILRYLRGQARVKIDVGGQQDRTESRSQLFKNLTDLLEYWEGLAGMEGGGVIGVGTLNLNIDYTEEDLEAGL